MYAEHVTHPLIFPRRLISAKYYHGQQKFSGLLCLVPFCCLRLPQTSQWDSRSEKYRKKHNASPTINYDHPDVTYNRMSTNGVDRAPLAI